MCLLIGTVFQVRDVADRPLVSVSYRGIRRPSACNVYYANMQHYKVQMRLIYVTIIVLTCKILIACEQI